MAETAHQRKWRLIRERQEAKASALRKPRKPSRSLEDRRTADRIDGFDRDDLGLSPDY